SVGGGVAPPISRSSTALSAPPGPKLPPGKAVPSRGPLDAAGAGAARGKSRPGRRGLEADAGSATGEPSRNGSAGADAASSVAGGKAPRSREKPPPAGAPPRSREKPWLFGTSPTSSVSPGKGAESVETIIVGAPRSGCASGSSLGGDSGPRSN